jgi:hypothetical protein
LYSNFAVAVFSVHVTDGLGDTQVSGAPVVSGYGVPVFCGVGDEAATVLVGDDDARLAAGEGTVGFEHPTAIAATIKRTEPQRRLDSTGTLNERSMKNIVGRLLRGLKSSVRSEGEPFRRWAPRTTSQVPRSTRVNVSL